MTIEERQVFIDEIVGMIEDYLFEKDIDMKSDVATQIVVRAAAGFLAEYAANPEKDAAVRDLICFNLGQILYSTTWAESCLIDERRAQQ